MMRLLGLNGTHFIWRHTTTPDYNARMNMFRRITTVAEEACNRLCADRGKTIWFQKHRKDWKADEFFRKLFSWHNSPTGIIVEDRGFTDLGAGLWLNRADDEFEIPLRPDERLHSPVVVSSGAPVAVALILKLGPRKSPQGYNFSRLIRILLPGEASPLRTATVETALERDETTSPRWWPFQLESISDDGQRVLLRRGDEVVNGQEMRVDYRAFRFNLTTKEWERIEP